MQILFCFLSLEISCLLYTLNMLGSILPLSSIPRPSRTISSMYQSEITLILIREKLLTLKSVEFIEQIIYCNFIKYTKPYNLKKWYAEFFEKPLKIFILFLCVFCLHVYRYTMWYLWQLEDELQMVVNYHVGGWVLGLKPESSVGATSALNP